MIIGLDISQAIYGTGVSDYVVDLVRHLPPDIIVPFGYSLRRYPDLKRLVLKGVSLPFPPMLMHYLWNKLHIFSVERFTGTIDVYHSSDWTQGPSKAKKVTTVHDLAPFIYPQETSLKIVSVHTARMHWVVHECDKIICVSQSTANDLVRLFPSTLDRIVVIPEALPSRFLLSPEILNLGSYILTIGARQPRKNIRRLISAFVKYKHSHNLPKKLIILGEKPISNLELQISNSVEFTGYVSDQRLVNYLAGAQAFVYPSLYEGFGLPILGAFHHCIPIACSDISVFHQTAGPAAQFFDPLDEESIAFGISQAIKNKNALIKLGSSQLKKFSWQKTATQTQGVYNSLQ